MICTTASLLEYAKLAPYWRAHPHVHLRSYPNGTVFLLKNRLGSIRVCKLCGNLETDQSWKTQYLDTFKIIRLENQRSAEFIVLYTDVNDISP